MARDAELDRLHAAQQRAFERKQEAYRVQQSAWERRSAVRDTMNRAYELKQCARDEQNQAWQHYSSVKSYNGPRIDSLNAAQERAFQDMKRAYENASSAYERRAGAGASSYAADGRRYKEEAQNYVAERRRLVEEIRVARAQLDAHKPGFQRAKEDFAAARQAFQAAKAAHERAQADFKRAKAEFDAAAKAFQARLKVVRARQRQHRDMESWRIAAKAGVPLKYRDEVVISTGKDGNINIYFGGISKPDGPGHGHYSLNQQGQLLYKRDPFSPHGKQNFVIAEDSSGTLYDRRVRRDTLPMGVRNRDNDTKERTSVFYDRNRDIDLHVTQYYHDNYRLSWDTDGESDRRYHWTDQNVSSKHPQRHTPPYDA